MSTLTKASTRILEKESAPHRGNGTYLVICVLVLAVLAVLSIVVGTKPLPLSDVWHGLFQNEGTDNDLIITELRIPRTVLGVLAGAALALAGAAMQSITRNPLADPGILGVNAGAAFAVVAGIAFLDVASFGALVWLAVFGAGVATVAVYAIGSSGRNGVNPAKLALAGAALTAVLSGAISAVVLVDWKAFEGYRSWNVGTLAGRNMEVVYQVLPFILVGLVMLAVLPSALNALALGDDMARGLGANTARVRMVAIIATTLLCGAATAAVGPISFVGLIAPHVVRAFVGPDNRWVFAFCAVVGPILLLASDIAGRLVVRPNELQTALVTAAIGAPVFIWVVRRRRLVEL